MQCLDDIRNLLKQQFGFDQLRPYQERVFSEMLKGRSGLIVMPTGGGKSLLYQLWARPGQGLVMVLSPLVALMQDQADQAKAFGIRATCINATIYGDERERRMRQLRRGEIDLLLVTPERFRKPEFLDAIKDLKVSLMAVDEAHCIAQWGHDFRPDYTRLNEIREILGKPQTLALTATATPRVQQEILQQLDLNENAFLEVDSVDRPELSLNVHSVVGLDEKIRAVVGLRFQTQGSMIVYGSLISTLYKVSDELGRLNLPHQIYHGQLKPGERHRTLREFQDDPNAFLLATPAFGLGINKPDVRAVIHLEMPLAIEAYFQEVGRAGRDGRPASGHLLFDEDDASIQMDFIKWANPDAGFIQSVYRLISDHAARVAQEGAEFLRDQMNFYNSRDFRVETSLNTLEKWGCLRREKNRLGFVAVHPPTDEDFKNLQVEQRLKVQNQKLLQMLEWAGDVEGCRMRIIQSYFGQPHEGRCGRCDNCLKNSLEKN